MITKQLSVFMENRSGRLEDVLKTLAEHDINMTALSLADTSEYGMLRMVVSDAEKARNTLRENGFSASLTDVICVEVENESGSLLKKMERLLEAGISVEYMYAFSKGDQAMAVLKCTDLDAALAHLK